MADAAGDDDEQVIRWVDEALTHVEAIESLVADGPSGSGIDSGGTMIDLDVSTPERLVFHTVYQHMNGGGYYWTEHTVTVRPSLEFCIIINVSGRDRNGSKDEIHDVFATWLETEV